MIYGYARVSTQKQSITRQLENIRRAAPGAIIIEESYTGTTTDRPAWNRLRQKLTAGDTVIFDEVSRMSRNAVEGIALYSELFDAGVNLEFLKEPHINTSVYREKMQIQAAKLDSTGSKATDRLLEAIMKALHDYTIDLAREQIEIAFRTAQAEVDFLHQRTSEGVRRAQAEGKQVGRAQGARITTKKETTAKAAILKYSRDFGGSLADPECMKLAGCSRNSFYKYKRELLDDQTEGKA